MNIPELPKQNPMQRKINKGLMVAFINADLLNRANLDVRKSIVLYDADGDFRYALSEMPDETILAKLKTEASVAYWSKGI
ncbi:hypothetical protein [Rhodococcus sp. NCIMB 12038]|uniref:hypothetical protein n=1 Tax=Rhodococcus sp. NCIMB 12038 TaxID=933800 RepID=UPI000B3D4890|nr:hypothetical protein [Rhodococcus sp. NCIMB 12038]OUS97435.1 hypothetical protein CA951_03580 [Rhodococcus sp. NCIMB 12038]